MSEPKNKLDTELQAYAAHKDELIQSHEGKYVLIHGNIIVGVYDTKLDAVGFGHQQLGTGPFLVKKVERVEKPVRIFLPGR